MFRREAHNIAPVAFAIATATGFHTGIIGGPGFEACDGEGRSATHIEKARIATHKFGINAALNHPIIG